MPEAAAGIQIYLEGQKDLVRGFSYTSREKDIVVRGLFSGKKLP